MSSPHRKPNRQQLAEEFAKEKEEYYLLLANAGNRAAAGTALEHADRGRSRTAMRWTSGQAPAMREMIQAAKEDGVELMLCSAYRSIEKQQQLFDRSQQAYCAQGMA